MTESHNKLEIIKTENIGFNNQEEKYLTGLFATTAGYLVPTLAREVWFKLSDFSGSQDYNLDGFILLIVRKTIYNQDQWHGIFQGDKKRFKLVAILEKNGTK
jgi:hypothetical protein